MKNNKKTKTQLITELEELRKQNAELEAEKTVRRKEEETLKVSEKNYSKIFNNAGVSFWEYDFTNALLITDRLKAKGITDFRSYFEENPKIAKKLISSIKLTDITDTTLKLYSARTKDELLVSLGKKESPESYKTFLDATIAYLKGN